MIVIQILVLMMEFVLILGRINSLVIVQVIIFKKKKKRVHKKKKKVKNEFLKNFSINFSIKKVLDMLE